jgi:hypothetical protein
LAYGPGAAADVNAAPGRSCRTSRRAGLSRGARDGRWRLA